MPPLNIDQLVNIQPICNELGIEYGLYSSYMKRIYRKRLKERGIPDGIINGEEIFFPSFELSSSPTVKMSDIKARRFNIIDRVDIITGEPMHPVFSMKSKYIKRIYKKRNYSSICQDAIDNIRLGYH